MSFSVGDRVKVRAPGTPWHNLSATVVLVERRRVPLPAGSLRYTVRTDAGRGLGDGRELYANEEQLSALSGRDERQRYCKDCGCRVDDKGRGYHERGCRRRKDVLTGRPWGVYPHAEWAGDHVETTGRGYVAREVSGAVPYGRMHPLRVFARRQDAEKMAERLSFGPGRAFSRDARRARARRHGRRRLPTLG